VFLFDTRWASNYIALQTIVGNTESTGTEKGAEEVRHQPMKQELTNIKRFTQDLSFTPTAHTLSLASLLPLAIGLVLWGLGI